MFELLVVLAIIGVMSALAAPRFLGSINRMNLKTGAKKTAAGLRYARDQAASRHIALKTEFDLRTGRLTITPVAAASGLPALNAGLDDTVKKTRHKTYVLPEGVRYEKGVSHTGESMVSGRFPILFYPSGASSGGEIIISGGRRVQYRVQVDVITGIVRLNEQWAEE